MLQIIVEKPLETSKLTLLSSPLHNLSPNPFVIFSFKMSTRFSPLPLHPHWILPSLSPSFMLRLWKGPSERVSFPLSLLRYLVHNRQKKLSKLVLLTCHPNYPKEVFLISQWPYILSQVPTHPHQPGLLELSHLGQPFSPTLPNTPRHTCHTLGVRQRQKTRQHLLLPLAFCLGPQILPGCPPALLSSWKTRSSFMTPSLSPCHRLS